MSSSVLFVCFLSHNQPAPSLAGSNKAADYLSCVSLSLLKNTNRRSVSIKPWNWNHLLTQLPLCCSGSLNIKHTAPSWLAPWPLLTSASPLWLCCCLCHGSEFSRLLTPTTWLENIVTHNNSLLQSSRVAEVGWCFIHQDESSLLFAFRKKLKKNTLELDEVRFTE